MGSSAEDVATLVRAFGEREEVAALELNVSCPNVKTGLLMGADPGETAALLDAVRPCTAKPRHREAHAQLHVAGRRRGRGRGPRGGRGLAHQHGARHGHASAPPGRAVARRRHRRASPDLPSAPWRSRRCVRSARASRCRSSGWEASRAVVMRKTCSTPARTSSRSVRRPSGIRARGDAHRRRARKLRGSAERTGTRACAHSTRTLKNACKTPRYRQVTSTRLKVKSRSSRIRGFHLVGVRVRCRLAAHAASHEDAP